MKKIVFGYLAAMLIFSCQEAEDVIPEIKIYDQSVDNGRISILNQSIQLLKEVNFAGEANLGSVMMGEIESPSFDCGESITEAFSGNKKVDKNKIVCLEAGVNFNGSLDMKGGTFVIKGNAVITSIKGDRGTIVVLESGSITMGKLHLKHDFEFLNYGTVTVSSVTNQSTGKFENIGVLTVDGDFNSHRDFENFGFFNVIGDLKLEAEAIFENQCTVIVEGDFKNNKTFINNGYVEVQKTMTVTGKGVIQFKPQSYIVTENLKLDGTLQGSSNDYARIDVRSNSTMGGGSKVIKNLSFNDFDGIEVNNGTFDESVTMNDSFSIIVTDCNPGPFVEPLNPEYTLVANINTPIVDGSVLSATDVAYNNGLAFISYHLNGSEFGGAIDVLNMAAINAPYFNMNFVDSKREFNAITFSGSTLYMAGQRNVDESKYSSNDTRGAVLYSTDLDGQNQLSPLEDWTEIPMPSYSGNSVDILPGNKVQFASGASNGGFFTVNMNSETITNSTNMDFAKSVTSNNGVKVMLAGGSGEAHLIIDNNGSIQNIPLGKSAMPTDGKNVVVLNEDRAYVTLGKNGLVVVNINTGEVINEYNPDKPGLTNGVAVDKDFVYLANGESGLLLLRKNSLEFYGQYKYPGSANLVEVSNNVILIANGRGGIKLLQRNM
jgi:hypothetical protein